jgi:hypothetical protein
VLTMARKMKQHASGRQPGRKQASEQNAATTALQVRIKMVSSYDPCNERVTG